MEAPRTETPVRAVVIGPSTLSNLAILGNLETVVGVSDFSTGKEVKGLPRVGGLVDPDLEKVVQLRPDCVLVQGKSPMLEEWCGIWGVEHVEFSTDSVRAWAGEIEFLQRRFGLPVEPIPLDWPEPVAGELKALLVVGRDPGVPGGVLAAGSGSFLSEMLTKAGGVNILAEGKYVNVDPETLVALDPAVIFDLAATPGRDPLEDWRRAYPGVAAVKAGRTHPLEHPDALLPGPRMGEVATLMAELLRTP